ncbi:MAG: hypothetical protein ABSC05_23460 [Candidatus Solibacter sp.]|jgi:hypothetical protein
MSSVSIHLTIEPEHGRPVSLARITDGEMLRQVARAAIREARLDAIRAKAADPMLGLIQDDEVSRLQRYFGALIPGFSASTSAPIIPTGRMVA